ncbi:MAG: 4'-phosphopantetheinyl transferase superfamily protein [Candidatus Firestonebacteria bacterium]
MSRPLFLFEMKLKGLGVDIFEKKRMKAALAKTSAGLFLKKVFLQGEIRAYSGERGGYIKYSVMFALKEAVLKALGMGWNAYANFCDIRVEFEGKTANIHLSGKTAKLAKKKGVKKIISDYSVSPRHVVAVAALV